MLDAGGNVRHEQRATRQKDEMGDETRLKRGEREKERHQYHITSVNCFGSL